MTRLLSIGMVLMTATTGTIMAQKQTPPEGGTPKDFVLPESITFSLENGLQATLIPYGALPKVTVRAVIRAGNINEGPNEVWLADLLGDFLEEGTTTKDARTIAEEAAGMGGEIGVSVSEDQTTVSSSVLSEFGPEIVALIADVVRNPALPESELQRLRNDRIRELSIQMADPNSIALQRFRSLLYPDHPYGRLFPTEEMLKSYTIGQVRQFHQANIGAARTHIYVAGKFDAREMENAIRKAFSDWTRGSEPLVMVPSPRSAREIHILNRPGAPQSTVYLGLPTIDPSKPDYRPLLVMNALLGGSFMSRITSNIREDKGYTYSPSSSVSSRYRDA
ncbi:MAG: insulinase family protein, partial [Ignavibacteria bacterium]|nr:insulinase family protein [Ignavibacteria bacterium]